MVKVNGKYYIGDLAKLCENEILDSIREENPYPGAYFLTAAVNKAEQLDIVDSRTYFSPFTRTKMEILGIACGKKEALLLVKQIADDVYRNKKADDIRSLFK